MGRTSAKLMRHADRSLRHGRPVVTRNARSWIERSGAAVSWLNQSAGKDMRFIRGPIPEEHDFQPTEQGWNSIREPDPVWMQVFAVPIILVTAALLFVVITLGMVVAWRDVLGRFVLAYVFMIPVHELIHAFVTPAFGMSRRTLVGFWPSRLLFYTHYDGELPRQRLLAILVAPIVLLTVLPLLLCAIFDWNAPTAVAVACANGIGAAGDILGIAIVLTRIPRGAIVRNKGWRSYWKTGSERARSSGGLQPESPTV